MSMEVANKILNVSREARLSQGKVKENNLSNRTFRSGPSRPTPQPNKSYLPAPSEDQVPLAPPTDPRRPQSREEMYRQNSGTQSYGGSAALDAAKLASHGNIQSSPKQSRPDMAPRSATSQTAMNAAAAALANKDKRTSPQKPGYNRGSTSTPIDYATLSGQRGPGGILRWILQVAEAQSLRIRPCPSRISLSSRSHILIILKITKVTAVTLNSQRIIRRYRHRHRRKRKRKKRLTRSQIGPPRT